MPHTNCRVTSLSHLLFLLFEFASLFQPPPTTTDTSPANHRYRSSKDSSPRGGALSTSDDALYADIQTTSEPQHGPGSQQQQAESGPKPIAVSSCLKLLVTNNVAGSIIGKSGETILKLQRDCGCRVKLSQAHDFFPGTSDRVCLLQGESISSVKQAIGLILKKFRDVRVSAAFSLVSLSSLKSDSFEVP
jgi:hypothetical protein